MIYNCEDVISTDRVALYLEPAALLMTDPSSGPGPVPGISAMTPLQRAGHHCDGDGDGECLCPSLLCLPPYPSHTPSHHPLSSAAPAPAPTLGHGHVLARAPLHVCSPHLTLTSTLTLTLTALRTGPRAPRHTSSSPLVAWAAPLSER